MSSDFSNPRIPQSIGILHAVIVIYMVHSTRYDFFHESLGLGRCVERPKRIIDLGGVLGNGLR